MSARTCGAARRVVSAGPPACGWLRGTSRTSPGPPRRWRGPGRLRSTSARGRGFAAYLSACGGQPLQRPRCGLRQGGASLTTFGFVTTVPRYLPVASNSLTCVRGADRAYCAPRKWLWRPTFALQKLAAARPPEGHWRAHPAAAPCRRHFAAAALEKSLSAGTRLVASAVGCGGRCRSTSRRTNNKNMFARRLAEQ